MVMEMRLKKPEKHSPGQEKKIIIILRWTWNESPAVRYTNMCFMMP